MLSSWRWWDRLPGLAMTPAIVLVALVAWVPPAWSITTDLLMAPTGEAPGDFFGISAAGAGDVNGDGYDDVIVGSQSSDAGGTDAGRAYVFYGGPGADAMADLTLTGAAAGDLCGVSVAGAGDVNGDGFDDVIVGAPYNDAGGTNAGRAYVFYGGPGADAVADLILTGFAAGDLFGYSVAGAGDVNGDGVDDVIVGSQFSDAGGTNAGQAYLFCGGPGADAVADLTLTGAAAEDHFGNSVAAAGDVNGDGFDDVIVGAYTNDAAGVDAGRAYLFYGGSTLDSIADLTLTGAAAGDHFGNSVAGAGDINGNGFDDVIVGAAYNDAAGVDAGRAYVFYGGQGADAVADLTLTGTAAGDDFGFSAARAGDVNGDGFDDVIVGAYTNDAAGTDAGRAYVYYGGSAPNSVADLTLTGAAAWDHFGYSAAGVGDVDLDGFDDVIVGAYSNGAAGTNAGRAYVYGSYAYRIETPNGGETWAAGEPAKVRWRGHDVADLAISCDAGATWTTLAVGVGGEPENTHSLIAPATLAEYARVRLCYSGQTASRSNSDMSDGVFRIVAAAKPVACRVQQEMTGEAGGDRFGRAVAPAGDMNGDGFADILVGAYKNDVAGTDAGRAYLYDGGPGADAVADLVFTAEAPGDQFGYSLGSVGDVNGDGFDDVIVGANWNDAGGTDAGRAYLYHGGPGADAVADLILTGEAAGDYFGRPSGPAGDVNGDGYPDIFVGACGNDAAGTDAGRAYVYFGGPSLDTVADLVLTGGGGTYGARGGTAGDVNGDGFDDIVVGAALYNATGTAMGQAYVYFGGASADSQADLVLTGVANYDYFGEGAGTAGDVNGDGYDDLIVGAMGSDAGGASGTGAAYVFFGGPAPDAAADLIITGEAAGDVLGASVGTAGDVNGDGFADILVGAHQNDAAGAQAGRAYVFFGGAHPDASADITLSGVSAYDTFGISVAAAGDLNGDGFPDVVVGADGSSDAGGTDAGRAYVYDLNRYHLVAPSGGDIWNVGAEESIAWLGAERADIWLSVDGGGSYALLRESAGGSAYNGTSLTVPHRPTRFAKVKVVPHDASVLGAAESDSLFTIEASIALLNLKAEPGVGGGVLLSWETDPGPEELAGYRIERTGVGREDWSVLAGLVRETRYHDLEGGPGMRYRLLGINGLGEALLLGETGFSPRAALAAWPLPYRGGALNVSFAIFGALGTNSGRATVTLHDLQGRLVRTIGDGRYGAGYQTVTWDGCDEAGRPVAAGVYFLRAASAGERTQIKVVVAR